MTEKTDKDQRTIHSGPAQLKPAKAGRPKIKLDTNLIEDLAGIFCTNREIASIMNCSTDTLVRNYADHIKKGRDRGKSSLRRKQWEKAMDGNTTMLIWLGKNYLNQADQPIDTDNKQPLPWTDEEKIDKNTEN